MNNDKMNYYISLQNDLQSTSKEFQELKSTIATSHSNLNSQLTTKKHSYIFEIVSLSLSILVVSSAVAAVTLPLDDGMRIRFAGGAVAGAVILSLVMHSVPGLVTSEGFALTGLSSSSTIANITAQMEQVIDNYLQGVAMTTAELSKNMIFDGINTSLTKELQFYQFQNRTSKLTNYKLNNVDNAEEMYNRWATTRMNLYLSIALISSAMSLIYLLLAFSPQLQKIVVFVGIGLIVVAVFIAIIEMVSLVRTDGDKFYWSNV